ncbi:MAG: hypothetical protein FJ030_12415 [Chloroflexi bacterium]|nr:hypothetical protein [Chloroflexota bacterium]
MSAPINARIVYLIQFPNTEPASASSTSSGRQRLQPPLTKQAPYFLDLDIELTELSDNDVIIDGQPVAVRRQVIDGQVVSVECAYTLADVLSPASNARKQIIQTKLHDTTLAEHDYRGAFVEEYTIVCLSQIGVSSDEFVQANRVSLASLLRSLPAFASESEVDQVLVSRARYTERDLTVVDWEGALIIDDEQDFQSDIELLKIGNYELLRYRLLDRAIDRNLQTVRDELENKRRLGFFSNVLRQSLRQRLELLLNFEKTEQGLLLIGDWYTAQLYRLIVDEFYIDEWKAAVKGKLDQLESITDIIHENFTLSWEQFLDLVQVIGWLVLLIGYFVLFYFDVASALK